MESSVHSNAILRACSPRAPAAEEDRAGGVSQGVGGSRFPPTLVQVELGHVAPRLCWQVQGAEDDAGLDFHT